MSYGGGYDSYGGGFNDSQSGTQGSPSRSKQQDTLRPVTIKQILEAQTPLDDSHFVIDDFEVFKVTFIAQIRSSTVHKITTTYKMEDGTGAIEVKRFSDKGSHPGDDEDGEGGQNNDPGLQVNSYARVVGNIKQFGDKRTVSTSSLRPVTDFNEIQCHFLEATATHLHFKRGPPESQQAQNTGGGGTAYQQGGSYGEDTAMGNTPGLASAAAVLPSGISPTARKIYLYLKNRPDSTEGMHVNMIGQNTGINMSDTYKAVDELLTNGVCFTTMDDEHIACMDF